MPGKTSQARANLRPRRLVLDTDIGDDIDDALALALICNSPELELLGVTTVFRDAPRRALLARDVLRRFGAPDVPVRAGVSQPLLRPWSEIPWGGAQVGRQFEALDPDLCWEESEHAVDFLARQCAHSARCGEKLLVAAIGPLTNIALLLARYPETAAQLELLIMGGQWSERFAEWNIFCDPEAAAIVFRSGAPLQIVGLDVTLQCLLSDGDIERLRQTNEKTRFLAELVALWGHQVTLHDPLTLLSLVEDCVKFEAKRLQIGLCGDERALTIEVGGAPNCQIAVAVDAPRAVAAFMRRIII